MQDPKRNFYFVAHYKIPKNKKNIMVHGKHFPLSPAKQPQTTNSINQRKETQVTYFNSLVSAWKAWLTMWIYFAFASGDLPLNIKALPTVTFFKPSLSSAELTT